MQSVDRVLARVTELPFSPVAGKILELTSDARIGAREIARIITQDQAFTARLLKIANSPYYGQARPVTTVTQAVPVLGIDTISSLAMALASFAPSAGDDGAILTMRDLWEHSIGCAIWGRQLARHIGHRAAEETFIAGLLHDMGKAVFYRFFKNEFLDAVRAAQEEKIDLLEAERRVLETDHAKAGAVVAAKWNLPSVLIHTIEFHHRPLSLPREVDSATRKTVALIHVADILCDHFQIGRALELDTHRVSDEIWDFLGLDLAACQDLLSGVLGEVSEFRNICDLSTGTKKNQGAKTTLNRSVRKAAPSVGNAAVTPGAGPRAAASGSRAMVYDISRVMDAMKKLALLAGIEDLWPNIADQAMTMLDADAACVFLPVGDHLEITGTANFPQLAGKRFTIAQSLAGWVAKMGESMVVPNIDKAVASWEKDLFTAAGFRSHLFLPIDWAGKRMAVLSIHSRADRLWSAEQISLINMFCGFVAVVLENSGLYREAEDRAKALEEVNRQLQNAVNVKTRFLGKVSHELRSPLCVIMGYANLIAEQAFGALPLEAGQAVERILKQANALLTVLTYMLEVSQLEAGKIVLRHGPLDARGLLDEAAAAAPARIGNKPIVFETDYAAVEGWVFTDPDRLKQVLTHLLDNAVKFTDEGKIVLRARAENGFLDIVVEDTGIGIDPKHQKFIFDGFRQVDDDDARRYDGMGIGLYLARRLLDLLGGEIQVESEPGSGSRFKIRLPCNATA